MASYYSNVYNQPNVYGGPRSNGTAGSQTMRSRQNANTQAQAGQQGGGATAPHVAYGNLADQWAAVYQGYMNPNLGTAQPGVQPLEPQPQPQQASGGGDMGFKGGPGGPQPANPNPNDAGQVDFRTRPKPPGVSVPVLTPGEMYWATNTTPVATPTTPPATSAPGPAGGGGSFPIAPPIVPPTTPPATSAPGPAGGGGSFPLAPGSPTAPPAGPTPPNTTPPPVPQDPTNWKEIAYPYLDQNALAANLYGYYAPSYQQAQQDLGAQMKGLAALTGDVNSGGFSEVYGRDMGRLIASQQADFGDRLQTAEQNERDRLLQRYQTDVGANTDRYSIDAQKFGNLLQDATQRYGIQTNAELERFLGEQRNALEKYGIDTNKFIQMYQAELGLKGQQYSADKGFDAAALRAAVDRYVADSNYDLGALNVNAGIYNTDVNDRYRWEYLKWLMSPEARMGGGLGFQLPGTFPY